MVNRVLTQTELRATGKERQSRTLILGDSALIPAFLSSNAGL